MAFFFRGALFLANDRYVSYAMNWLVVLPLEITAALKVLHFWQTDGSFNIPEAVFVTIFLVVG